MKNEKKENKDRFLQKCWQPVSRGIVHSAPFRDLIKICLLPMMPVAIAQGIMERDIVVFSGNILMILIGLILLARLIMVYLDKSYRREPSFWELPESRTGFSAMGWVLAAWYMLLFGCYVERSPRLFIDFALYVTPVFVLVLLVLAIRQWKAVKHV